MKDKYFGGRIENKEKELISSIGFDHDDYDYDDHGDDNWRSSSFDDPYLLTPPSSN